MGSSRKTRCRRPQSELFCIFLISRGNKIIQKEMTSFVIGFRAGSYTSILPCFYLLYPMVEKYITWPKMRNNNSNSKNVSWYLNLRLKKCLMGIRIRDVFMKIITVSIDCTRSMLLALNFTPCPPLNTYVVCIYLFWNLHKQASD